MSNHQKYRLMKLPLFFTFALTLGLSHRFLSSVSDTFRHMNLLCICIAINMVGDAGKTNGGKRGGKPPKNPRPPIKYNIWGKNKNIFSNLKNSKNQN